MKKINFWYKKIALVSTVMSFLVFPSVNAQETNNIGETTFKNECASCHTGGFKGWVSGSPEIGVKADWVEFFKKSTLEMTQATIKGTEGMDPKGGCKNCTDEEIEQAVEYIVTQTK